MKVVAFGTFEDHNIKNKGEAVQKKLSFHYQRKVVQQISLNTYSYFIS